MGFLSSKLIYLVQKTTITFFSKKSAFFWNKKNITIFATETVVERHRNKWRRKYCRSNFTNNKIKRF